ncbi:MAG: apolipoprotein N-acyltransferase [Treponema sp.]|nr:apolipoprotein N-acyltransferase [Treponema sp.]
MTKRFLCRCGAIVLASVLFFLSHPNPLFANGLGLLGFVALVPVFLLIPQVKLSRVWLYGLAYGIMSYALLCSWLFTFRWYTIYFACLAYGLLMALVFLLMKVLSVLRPSLQFLSMPLVWLCYEYVKTLGFAGLHYGILAYTQWRNSALRSLASVGGVWLVSAVVVAFSAALSAVLYKIKNEKLTRCNWFLKLSAPVSVFLACGLCHFWGMGLAAKYRMQDTHLSLQTVSAVAVQSNTDPWKMGVETYRRDLKNLMHLTEDALQKNPDAQIVVWPETAFVPPLVKNYTLKNDVERYNLVLELLSFIEQHDVCFVIGNQHSVDEGKPYYSDYNATLVFDRRCNQIIPPEPFIYKKQHLVPFTEWFPYGTLFPHVYNMLLEGDTHLWDQGTEPVVFTVRDVPFATPICFEDTFSDVCRSFVCNGARCFINVSNDAWSKSLACQMQHLSMAVFRSAENHVPSVRSTASGMTVHIDAAGSVVQCAVPFTASYIVFPLTVTESSSQTLYTKWGDWFAWTVIVLTLILAFSELAVFVHLKLKR